MWLIISDLKELEIITKNMFEVVQRSLSYLTITNCPKLYAIEQRDDYPHYPLPRLHEIHLENLDSLSSLEFLNSQFSNRKSTYVPAHSNVSIEITGNDKLKTILLNRPLSFKGENNVELIINSGANVSSRGILNICFLKRKVK